MLQGPLNTGHVGHTAYSQVAGSTPVYSCVKASRPSNRRSKPNLGGSSDWYVDAQTVCKD